MSPTFVNTNHHRAEVTIDGNVVALGPGQEHEASGATADALAGVPGVERKGSDEAEDGLARLRELVPDLRYAETVEHTSEPSPGMIATEEAARASALAAQAGNARLTDRMVGDALTGQTVITPADDVARNAPTVPPASSGAGVSHDDAVIGSGPGAGQPDPSSGYPPEGDEGKPLGDLTKRELQDIAADENVEVGAKDTKAELVEKIESARSQPPAE